MTPARWPPNVHIIPGVRAAQREPGHAEDDRSDALPAAPVSCERTDSGDPPADAELRPHEVELRMVAGMARISTVRAVAADVAMREDFDLDAVSDLRLAVDEACTTVLTTAKPDGMLVCRLMIARDGVEISASAETLDGRPPPKDTLGWHMLQVLVDSVECWTTTDQQGERTMHVRITKDVKGSTAP
jgi:serine/threonine-protein kinase RsbW